VGTVVNVLVGLLRGNNSGGLVSVIFRNVLAAAADVMWQLITFFVMPAMMLDDLGMIDAIKKSASTFKQRWGTQLSGGVRIGGLIGLIAVLPAILALVVGVVLVTAGVPAAGVPLAVIGLIVLIVAGLILSAIRGVFSVVLYRFATQGICEGGFTEEQLAGAVKVKA
jgi:membrane-anchored glycerophosphoryl diester phosphodiesterase (GDPDase)